MSELRKTALWDEHQLCGAKLVPFAGWEMPVQYAGVREEVRAVRETCGVFDVSHMGQLEFSSPQSGEILNRIVSANWSQIAPGRVAYALLLNDRGGVVDDVMGYHLPTGEWFLVVNASRAAVDEAHLQKYFGAGGMANGYHDQAMLAIQGPRAQSLLEVFTLNCDLSAMRRRDCAYGVIAGVPGLIARGGYTGSDGFEFMCAAADAPNVWRTLLGAGAVPCGLGARDVLRLEAALPLYGHELREEWTPYESGCGWAVKMDKPEFVGRDALLEKTQPSKAVRALKMHGNGIPREGYAVWQNEKPIGEITSGTFSPTLGSGIALAMVPATLEIGQSVQVQIRDRVHQAEIVPRPFVPFVAG